MTGLEVVAVITAISTLFVRGLDFLQNRKARKASKNAKETQLNTTEVVLRASGPAIRSQFDRYHSQIGHRFAVGDESTQIEIQRQFLTLQQAIDTLQQIVLVMVDSDSRGYQTDFDLSEIMATSDSVKSRCIDALMSQYHRMSEASPRMHRSLKMSHEWRRRAHCAEGLHHDTHQSRPSRRTMVARQNPSFQNDYDCLLRYLHDNPDCIPSYIHDLETQPVDGDSPSPFEDRQNLRNRKSRPLLLRSNEQASSTNLHHRLELAKFSHTDNIPSSLSPGSASAQQPPFQDLKAKSISDEPMAWHSLLSIRRELHDKILKYCMVIDPGSLEIHYLVRQLTGARAEEMMELYRIILRRKEQHLAAQAGAASDEHY